MATALRKRSHSRSRSSSDNSDNSRSEEDVGRRFKSVAVKMPSAAKAATPPPKRKKEEQDPLLTRTGGAYIPPARLRMMQEAITDKASAAYQRLTWEALKKSINGLVNKINVSNISNIVRELFQENLIRGKGVFTRSVIQAQGASPMFSHVYAALVAIINTKLPRVGELIIKRLMVRFKRSFSRKDKAVCISTVKFIAHLVNQHVLYELVALELLTLLLDEPTDDSVEVAVGFVKDCGLSLKEVNSQALHTVFETFRSILHSGKLTSRVQYMIEVLFAVRKDNFKDHPSVLKELDLVHEDDQHTHFMSLLDGEFDTEDMLNVFRMDPDYLENEEAYTSIREEILGEESEESGSEEEGSEESEEESEDEEDREKLEISDQTFTTELVLRRQIYLTIMSSLDFEECAHKLLKSMKEGQEKEISFMLVECCAQERSYMRFYGMLGQRLCLLNQAWVAVFDEAFQQQYSTVHRLETNKLRNVAKFFSQLLFVDALPWTSLACIHLNEEETNSSSRIFVKIIFQQLAEFMGLVRLNDRLRDPMLSDAFEGFLPRDNPKNTRFAINFFTSIGLGGLTDDLREHLKNAQKLIMTQKQDLSSDPSSSSSSSSSSDSSDESSSENESESGSSSSEEEKRKRKKISHSGKQQKNRHKQKDEKESHSRRRGVRASDEDGWERKGRDGSRGRRRGGDKDGKINGPGGERREKGEDIRRTERSPDERSLGYRRSPRKPEGKLRESNLGGRKEKSQDDRRERNTEDRRRERSPEDRRRERSPEDRRRERSPEDRRRERSPEDRRRERSLEDRRRERSPEDRRRERSPEDRRRERSPEDRRRERSPEDRRRERSPEDRRRERSPEDRRRERSPEDRRRERSPEDRRRERSPEDRRRERSPEDRRRERNPEDRRRERSPEDRRRERNPEDRRRERSLEDRRRERSPEDRRRERSLEDRRRERSPEDRRRERSPDDVRRDRSQDVRRERSPDQRRRERRLGDVVNRSKENMRIKGEKQSR